MYSTVEINAPVLTAAVAFPGHRHKRRPTLTIDARGVVPLNLLIGMSDTRHVSRESRNETERLAVSL